MSLIPAEDLQFADLVGEAFLAIKGSGLVLSPVDVELLRHYEAAAVPAEVLVRALLVVAERRRANGRPPPRSLSAVKRSLDAAVRRFQAGQIRGHAPLPAAETLDALLAHAREAPLPEERAPYRAAYRALCAGRPSAEAAALEWLARVPRLLQRTVSTDTRALVGPRLAPEPREEYRGRLRRALISSALEHAALEI